MARRNLAEVATPKSSLLRRTAQSVSNYQKQVTQDTNIKDLSEEQKSRLIYLKDDMLLDDPDNMEIYGESDVEALAEDMRKYGFQGVILAYKFKKGSWKKGRNKGVSGVCNRSAKSGLGKNITTEQSEYSWPKICCNGHREAGAILI